MSLTKEIARHLREIHFGGNWTGPSFKDSLSGVTWEQAATQIYSCNSIAILVYHMNFYLNVVSLRLQDKSVEFKHRDGFEGSPITSEQEWRDLLQKTWTDAEDFANLIEQFPEHKLWENISDEQGNYYKNIHGVVEHNHYHLGQIVLLKKILKEK
jgi:Protein of unknown function (DUF1572)